jgi:integrase
LSPQGSDAAAGWALTVIGKRRKQRTVPVSAATVRALREHWADRGRDFDATLDSAPLIVPLVIPVTTTALKKHGGAVEAPYTTDAFGHLVRQAIQRVTVEFGARADIPEEALVQRANTSAHAFRHTFGTRAVARDMPVDVVQAILGHASLQRRRSMCAPSSSACSRRPRSITPRMTIDGDGYKKVLIVC